MGNDSSFSVDRRGFLGGAAAAGITIGFGLPAHAQNKEFVTTVFGGVYEREYRKNIVDPFEKEFGARVLTKTGLSSEWLTNSIVNRNAPEIDLLLLPYPDNVRATMEDIGMPLSVADIPNMAELASEWYEQFNSTGVGLDYVGYGIAYREDLVPVAPTKWADLWKPEYQGRITIPEIGQWGSWEMLVMSSLINGGNEENVDPAFEALKRLKPNVKQFFKSGVDITNLLSSGEAWIAGMTTNIPAYGLIDAGQPVKFIYPEEGAMVGLVSYHIAKNSPNADLCKQFINFALRKDIQENFCNGVVAAPTNRNAVVDERTRARVPSADNLQLFDWAKIIPRMSELADRWNQEVAF